MDDGRAAWMCSCLKELRSREPELGGQGGMEQPKLVPCGEQRARALIKPRSEPGRGDALCTRRKTGH